MQKDFLEYNVTTIFGVTEKWRYDVIIGATFVYADPFDQLRK